jgi:hypothetical protein
MKSAQRLTIVFAILLLASCAQVQPQSPLGRLGPVSNGKAQLTAIGMPEYVHENLPYDVILDFRSDGPITIKRICFKWLSGQPSLSTSSANCLMGNGEVGGTGGECASGPQTGSITSSSGLFCVGPSDFRIKSPEQLIVRIHPQNLHADYNTLQAQVEYLDKGVLRETNIVQTPIIVEK